MNLRKTRNRIFSYAMLVCFSLVVISDVKLNVHATTSEVDKIKVGEINDKFEPWLWDKIQNLTLANSTQEITLVVRLEDLDGELTKADKINYANLFAEKYNAEMVYIAEALPVIIFKISVKNATDIATYDYVSHIGDGDLKVETCLNVSASVISVRPQAWDMGYRGHGMRIAIIDTGIDATHPDLDDIDDDPATNDPKVILARDFTGEGTAMDLSPTGHGTHVAGIAAGTGQWSRTNLPNNSWFIGVAPEAFLFNGRVFNSTGWSQVSWVVQAIDWAVNNGADVINLSLTITMNGDGTSTLSRATDDAVDRGVVVVVAANDWPDATGDYPIGIPADAFNVITVGAIDDNETVDINDDAMPTPNWSGHGPTLDGRVKPDVVALGVGIWSTGQWFRGIAYRSLSGTSMAAPHVAGVAALILQAHPDWRPHMVKLAIKARAVLNDNLMALTLNDRGWGIVDAERAVNCSIQEHRYTPMEGITATRGDWWKDTWFWTVPFRTRPPYLTPMLMALNITFTSPDPVTGVVYLAVQTSSYVGLEHIWYDETTTLWFRFSTIMWREDGFGWLFTGNGTNPIAGDVDCYTFSNNSDVYWGPESPKAGELAAFIGALPSPGPDGVAGTADDGFGDDTPDPPGSSILYLPTWLYWEYHTGTDWVPLFTYLGHKY